MLNDAAAYDAHCDAIHAEPIEGAEQPAIEVDYATLESLARKSPPVVRVTRKLPNGESVTLTVVASDVRPGDVEEHSASDSAREQGPFVGTSLADAIFAATREQVATKRVICPTEAHEAIKASPVQWLLLEYRGIAPAVCGGPAYEVRNCTCGSTLYKELPPLVVARFWLCASTHEIRIEFTDGTMSVFSVERGDGQYPEIDGHDDEDLALVAWNALGLGDCEDPRFAGWDADAWKAFDVAWAAKSEAA